MKWIVGLHLLCCFAFEYDIVYADVNPLPIFTSGVSNLTVTSGRNAQLTCKVENLGNYKVAWVRVDTQTILTIHDNIITRNQRISLSHHDLKLWRLHINNVQEGDRGWYMCQVNTDPMRSEKGYLEVVVPPLIIDSKTSPDLVVKEGGPVNLTCEARGSPKPKIMWRREDGEAINYKGGQVPSVDGNSLTIDSVSRKHIGAYFCIASNGVPPSISKRIELRVQFAPMIWVQNQLEYATVGRNITLQCNTEAFPAAIHYWKRHDGSAISSGKKYRVHQEMKNYITHVSLDIIKIEPTDFGTYFCVAKNSLGELDGAIKLQERILPSQETFHPPTLPPLFYSSPIDDVIGGRESRRPEQYAQNGRNAYDLVMPGVIETEKKKNRNEEEKLRNKNMESHFSFGSANSIGQKNSNRLVIVYNLLVFIFIYQTITIPLLTES